ncbi:hypothetical protein D3C78_983220 [compost metagenome]
MDAREGDELVLVAHVGQLLLEAGYGGIVQVLLPVEARGAVVGQDLVRVLGLDGFGKLTCLVQVRLGGFTPHHVGVRGVGQAAGDGLLDTGLHLVEALGGALSGQEACIVGVGVRGQQVGRVGVGTGDHQGGGAADVGRQTGRDQFLHRFLARHQHLATHVAALLDRGQLIFEVHAGGARFNHAFHQLEGVQHAAETGFGVRHYRQEVVDETGILRAHLVGPLDLVGTGEGVVDALHHGRYRVGRVEGLIRVHGGGEVVVRRHLPAGEVDGLYARLGLLHRLAAGQGAEAVDVTLLGAAVDQLPQLVGAALGQGVCRLQAATQVHHVFGAVAAFDPFPAGVFCPVFLDSLDLLLTGQCHISSLFH